MRAWLNRRFTDILRRLAKPLVDEAYIAGQRSATAAMEARLGRVRHVVCRVAITQEELAKFHLYGGEMLNEVRQRLANDVRASVKVRFRNDRDMAGNAVIVGFVTIIDNDQGKT